MSNHVVVSLFAMNLLLMFFGGGSVLPWLLESIVSPDAYQGGGTAVFPVNQTDPTGWSSCNRAEVDHIEACNDPYSCSELFCEMTLGIDPGNKDTHMWVLVEPPSAGGYEHSSHERHHWCSYHASPSYLLDNSEEASILLGALAIGLLIALLLASQRWRLLRRWCRKYRIDCLVWISVIPLTLFQVVFYALVMGMSSSQVQHPVLKAWFPYVMGWFSVGGAFYLVVFFSLWLGNPWLCPPNIYHNRLIADEDYLDTDN